MSTTTQYSYDETGNRAAKTVGGTTYTNAISPTSNRMNQVQDATGTATISHDAAGNVLGDGSFTFTYSDRGRMASVTTANGTVNYLYNGMGQRAKKSGPASLVGTGASHFVYDESGQLLGEYNANGTPLYETIYIASTPVGSMKQTGTAATSDIATTVYNVYADHIDTPRMITRQDETIVWRWDTAEAFGATAPDENPTGQGAFAYNQRFPGQVFDAETGLFQNWNRDYDARLGRYRQSDPIGLVGGINSFSYAGGSPLLSIDPLGLANSGTWMPWQNPRPQWSNSDCAALKKQIEGKYGELMKELEKYDPMGDARGGFGMPYGSGITKPGGHYKEIKQLQRGLKRDLEKYNKNCKCDDNNGNPPIPRTVDALANAPVQEPFDITLPWNEFSYPERMPLPEGPVPVRPLLAPRMLVFP